MDDEDSNCPKGVKGCEGEDATVAPMRICGACCITFLRARNSPKSTRAECMYHCGETLKHVVLTDSGEPIKDFTSLKLEAAHDHAMKMYDNLLPKVRPPPLGCQQAQ